MVDFVLLVSNLCPQLLKIYLQARAKFYALNEIRKPRKYRDHEKSERYRIERNHRPRQMDDQKPETGD